MTGKMQWHHRRQLEKPRTDIRDEREWREQDRAAKWLAKVDQPDVGRSKSRREPRWCR